MSRGRSVAERSIRLLGRDAANLDSTTGQNGEVFFDTTNSSLRVYDGRTPGGSLLVGGLSIEETQDIVGAMFASGVVHSGISVSYLDNGGGNGKLQLTGFSGSYNDLSNKPTLFDGNYNSLTNKPSIPSAQVQTDWNATSGLGSILNKPTLFSGNYNDLTNKPTIPGEVNLTGYATETYVNTQITNLIGTAGAALNTLGELSDALNDDANFASTVTTALSGKEPTITAGTTSQYWRGDKSWQTLNATAVGLGNVTNESKATMFTSPSFTGTSSAVDLTVSGLATFQETTEVLNTLTGATGTVTHDFSTGAIWYHTSIAANFTANFTNVPTTNNRATVCTLLLVQGATAYIPNAVQIAGASQTIKWIGGFEPSGTSNQVDFVSFTLIRVGSAWNVFGSLSTFG